MNPTTKNRLGGNAKPTRFDVTNLPPKLGRKRRLIEKRELASILKSKKVHNVVPDGTVGKTGLNSGKVICLKAIF